MFEGVWQATLQAEYSGSVQHETGKDCVNWFETMFIACMSCYEQGGCSVTVEQLVKIAVWLA